MENSRKRKGSSRGMEENTMAILDFFGAMDSTLLDDDRLAFLEAVRSASIVPEHGSPPTNKMFDAIFQILREAKSLELLMASYQLLNELEKRFPRVYFCNVDESNASSSDLVELIAVEEAWSPFALVSDVASSGKGATNNKSSGSLDSSGFYLLLEALAEWDTETEISSSNMKLQFLGKMLLLQYLVKVLGGDFFPRNKAFLENSDWTCLRESFLNTLLGSRRINYKGLIKDCLFIMSRTCHEPAQFSRDAKLTESSSKMDASCDAALTLALPEAVMCTCSAVQNLLFMIMQLDSSRKKADMRGLTTRADGVRTAVMELILDELTYNKEIISPFLQVFDKPKLKLEIILQYFQKYIAKPSIRTRKSNDWPDEVTLSGVWKCFSNSASTKTIVRKIRADVAQLLLAYGFQACMSLPRQQLLECISGSEDKEGNPLLEICKLTVSALTNLKKTNEKMEFLPICKEALFTAATILSTKSLEV